MRASLMQHLPFVAVYISWLVVVGISGVSNDGRRLLTATLALVAIIAAHAFVSYRRRQQNIIDYETTNAPMRCHYEVLGVSRTANDEDIKRAYRKLALKHHPDKNGGDDAAHDEFAQIQRAYDVLSDVQQRTYYDRHRTTIVAGKNPARPVRPTKTDGTPVVKDEPLSLSQFYSPSAYSGYGDDERSFYSVYRHVFETIVGEDERYMVRPGDARDIPTFGTAGSSYDQVCSVLTNQCTGGCHAQVVGPFYAHWSAYNTARTYTWLNDESEECANRAEARAIEKDNRKLREQAKRARNEEVQELVAHVRKRDPRVLAYREQLEAQREESLRKAEINRQRQIQEQIEKTANYKQADWEDNEDDLARIERELDMADEDDSTRKRGGAKRKQRKAD